MLTKPKAIVFDCDDVLLDYMYGLKVFLKEHYDIDPPGLPDDYTINEWAGLSGNKTMKILSHFNENSFEFGLLKPVHERVVQVLKELHTAHKDDVDFIIVTKSGTLGHGEVLRKVNLMNVFGDIFKDIIILEKHESKKGTLLKLKQRYDILCFVDDYIKNIDDAQVLDINSIVFERAHNTKYKDIQDYNFMSNWDELYKYLQDLIV